MLEIIPEKLKLLSSACPAPLYVVGGACRDYIAGLKTHFVDWDICAPAGGYVMAEIARSVGMEVKACYPLTGSLKLSDGGILYEFTSFRTDIYDGCGHRPVAVSFTNDIRTDAARRDFRCNAVYFDIGGGAFVDPLNGIGDIKNKKISPVAPPEKLFSEDALRIMRLARFCGELGFSADRDCLDGAARSCSALADIPSAQIRRELDGILRADKKYGVEHGHAAALRVLEQTGALDVVLGACHPGKDFFAAFGEVPEELRLCALFYAVCGGGQRLADCERDRQTVLSRCKAVGYAHRTAQRVAAVCSLSAFDGGGEDEKTLRRLLFDRAEFAADALALDDLFGGVGGGKTSHAWRRVYDKMRAEGVPFTVKELDVTADDLIKAGFARQTTGEILRFLSEECVINGERNVRERLLELSEARFGIK